ncbi:hypothetical protein JZ751_009201, partial [Albula glossodonta]
MDLGNRTVFCCRKEAWILSVGSRTPVWPSGWDLHNDGGGVRGGACVMMGAGLWGLCQSGVGGGVR